MPGIDHLIRNDFETVDRREALRNVMGWLQGNGRLPIVTDDGAPIGVVNERALMRRRIDPMARLENYTVPTKACHKFSEMHEVVERMQQHRAAYLPVESEGKTIGYVRAVDVARELGSKRKAADLAVPVTTLRPDQNIGEALHAFTQEYVDVLPVVREDGRLESFLPRRAIVEIEQLAHLARGRKDAVGEKVSTLRLPVHGFTDAQPPATLGQDAAFPDVLRMLEKRGHVFVEGKDGRLLGLITPETILRAAAL